MDSQKATKDTQFNLRMNTQIKAELTALAKTKGMKLAEYINFLLQKELEKSRGRK